MNEASLLLYRPTGSACFELVCKVSGQVVRLPAGESRLGSQEGELFIQTSGHGSQWVSDLLEFLPVDSELEGLLCMSAHDDSQVGLRHYLTQYQDFEVPLVLSGRAAPLSVLTHVHAHGFRCSQVFVQLPALKDSLHTGGMTGSEWCNSWVNHWRKRLERIEIDASWHLRRGMSTRGKAELQPALYYNEPIKCHPKITVSALALMVLLPQWAETKGVKDAAMSTSWQDLLRSLLQRVYPDGSELSWWIHDDDAVAYESGTCRGRNPLELHIASGVIQWVEPVSPSRCWQQTFRNKHWETEVTVLEFALFAQCGRKSPAWLAKQVAFHMASDFEAHVRGADTVLLLCKRVRKDVHWCSLELQPENGIGPNCPGWHLLFDRSNLQA
eukprot:3834817-Amphidinium_carterae.2